MTCHFTTLYVYLFPNYPNCCHFTLPYPYSKSIAYTILINFVYKSNKKDLFLHYISIFFGFVWVQLQHATNKQSPHILAAAVLLTLSVVVSGLLTLVANISIKLLFILKYPLQKHVLSAWYTYILMPMHTRVHMCAFLLSYWRYTQQESFNLWTSSPPP